MQESGRACQSLKSRWRLNGQVMRALLYRSRAAKEQRAPAKTEREKNRSRLIEIRRSMAGKTCSRRI